MSHQPDDARPLRDVSCDLDFEVHRNARVELQITAAQSAAYVVTESLIVSVDGDPADFIREIPGPHGSRTHLVDAQRGRLKVGYRATLGVAPSEMFTGADAPRRAESWVEPPEDYWELVYLRPSRYCQSDHLEGFALSEFGTTLAASDRVDAVVDWIHSRIEYLPGSGTVHDSAEDTLLTGIGTCRDFAHLGVALCRAIGVAARFTAVYAPGLSPMDFHAVFETRQGGRWLVHDATDGAPRATFVRIGTGRDAADVAFASFERHAVTLVGIEVNASIASASRLEDRSQPIELP